MVRLLLVAQLLLFLDGAKVNAAAATNAHGDFLSSTYTIDEAVRGREFLGYGVNPSAGTYRLLHDYPEPQRSELLDFMFKPNFGAAFHRIKVEIGGKTGRFLFPHPSTSNESPKKNVFRGWPGHGRQRGEPHAVRRSC